MNIIEIIREVSVDLNDQIPGYEYIRWPIAQLHSYLREALVNVSTKLRDLFISRIVVKVTPGGGWQDSCGCTHILRIVGEVDSSGDLLRKLSRVADDEANTWAGAVNYRCAGSPKNYSMTGYSISVVDDSEFRIYPPVPPGVSKYVLVECFTRPTGIALSDTVPDELIAMIKQWMLSRALAVDSENNPTIVQLADMHRKTFFELLQAALAERAAEKAENSDRLRTVQKYPAK